MFGGGLFFHAFLYNFYLTGLHFGPEVMGYAAAALTAGGLVALLPAGMLVDRLGARRALFSAGGMAALGLTLGALLATPLAIYGAAAIAGVGSGLWRVAVAPVLMRLTDERTRARAFAWNVGMILLSGAAGFAVAGALPAWLGQLFHVPSQTGVQIALLVGACATLVSIPLFWSIGLPATASVAPALDSVPEATMTPAPGAVIRALPFVAAVAVWMLGAAIITPFFNIYFARQFSLSMSRVGLVFALAQAVWALGVLGSGELATRLGARTVLFIALVVFAPAMWGLATARTLMAAGTLYLLQGFVGPVTNPLIDQVLLACVPSERHGAATGWRNVAADLSGIVGASLGGAVLQRGSFSCVFVASGAAGAIGAVGILAAMRRLRLMQPQGTN
jgi:DHA1 family multidrug resistance protein-like MFS transporter